MKTFLLYYLNLLAVLKIKLFFRGKIIGLAGCYGKSSAINLIESIISLKYKVKSSNVGGKGLNSETGIPFVVLDIKPDGYSFINWIKYSLLAIRGLFKKFDYEFLLIEMGVDKPNDMKFLTKFYKPDISILINSNNTHAANFEDLKIETKKSYEELIAIENGYIFEYARNSIFYNLEDPEVIKQIARFKGRNKFGYTSKNGAIRRFEQSLNGTIIGFKYYGEIYEVNFPTPLLEEYKSTIELCIKLAEYLQVDGKQIKRGLENYKLPAGRCQIFHGIKNTFILDSSYNSSYVPAASSLTLLKKIASKRKIAILGDMRELGKLSAKEHKKLALKATETADLVITVGPLMQKYFNPEFTANKKSNQEIYSFDTTKEALNFIKHDDYIVLNDGDTILIKGSQNTLLLEIIVEDLLKNKKDKKYLCRRGKFYDNERLKLMN